MKMMDEETRSRRGNESRRGDVRERFGQSAEETLTETSEEGVAAGARKAESRARRRWRTAVWATQCSGPHCVNGCAEVYGHRKRGGETVSLDYTYARCEQEKEEEKGMPIIAVTGNKAKMVTAKVLPSKGAQEYAVEVVRKLCGATRIQ